MKLTIGVYGAESYDLDDDYSLEQAIKEEADNAMSEANADHLEEPTEEEYEAFRERVISEATAALQQPGDKYTDPIGITWRLID